MLGYNILFRQNPVQKEKKKKKYVIKQYVDLLALEQLEIFFLPLL